MYVNIQRRSYYKQENVEQCLWCIGSKKLCQVCMYVCTYAITYLTYVAIQLGKYINDQWYYTIGWKNFWKNISIYYHETMASQENEVFFCTLK